MEGIGFKASENATASTIVARFNTQDAAYSDPRVRHAIQMGVDNAKVLELGMDGAGSVAENHHVGPMHIDYADIGPATHDSAQAARFWKRRAQVT